VKSLSSVGFKVEPATDKEQKESIVPEWIKTNNSNTSK
jgi:hypothetical protein